MKKIFALLLADFRKLGANVIFANFSKIIIDTGKVDLSSAHAYCDSLLKTLQTRDLFKWIELEPLHFWHSLVFMDQYNYGGIQAKTQNVDSSNGDNDIDIVSSWNMAEDLPKDTQDHFVLIVSEFLYIPWKFMKEQVATQATIRNDISCTPSVTVMAAENLEGQVIDHLRDKISNYFADKLLRTVSDILHHFKGKSKHESDEPANKEPDPHTHKGDAALEFIKHICAVLALDQNVQHDILRMRKNLLKLVRVKEFAPEAQFQDPSASFTLPNVICRSYETIALAAIAMIAGTWISAVTQHSKVRSGDVRCRSVGSHTTGSRWRTHFYRWSASERGCTTCRIWCACAAGK